MLMQLPSVPLSTWALITTSLRYYWLSLCRIRITLMLYIIFVLMSNSINLYFSLLLESVKAQSIYSIWVTIGYWALILLVLTTAVVGIWLQLFMFIKVHAGLHHSLATIQELYETSLRQFLSYFIASFLLFILVVFGLACFILPGIMLWVRCILWKPGIAVDNAATFTAMRTSWQLVRGHGWHVFGAGCVTMLCGALVLFLLLGGLAVIYIVLDIIFLHSHWQHMTLFMSVFVGVYIISALLLPLYYGFLTVLMHDLKLRGPLPPTLSLWERATH